MSNLRLPWKIELPWNFSLYWNIFYHSGFLSNLRLPWKTELSWNPSLYWIYFLHSGFLSDLRLPWKIELPWNFSLYWNIFLSFRIFEQLALALKTRVALKVFKPGGASTPRLVRLCLDPVWEPLAYVKGEGIFLNATISGKTDQVSCVFGALRIRCVWGKTAFAGIHELCESF